MNNELIIINLCRQNYYRKLDFRNRLTNPLEKSARIRSKNPLESVQSSTGNLNAFLGKVNPVVMGWTIPETVENEKRD